MMDDEELEAYLRKHTFNGQMREVRDTWVLLAHLVIHDLAALWTRILDTLGL